MLTHYVVLHSSLHTLKSPGSRSVAHKSISTDVSYATSTGSQAPSRSRTASISLRPSSGTGQMLTSSFTQTHPSKAWDFTYLIDSWAFVHPHQTNAPTRQSSTLRHSRLHRPSFGPP